MFVLWFIPNNTLLSISPSVQSNNLTEVSPLTDYLRFAALNNPGLKAAFSKWKAALERIPQVRSLPNPQFTFAYFIQEVETRVGPQRQKIGVMQMFPWFGKLKLMGKSALKAANVQKQLYENLKLKLFYQVKKIFYDSYFVYQHIDILKQNIELLKNVNKIVETRYQSGISTYSDLLKIQIELDKLSDRLRSKQDLLNPLKSKLNSILNRPFNNPISIPERILIPEIKFTYAKLLLCQKENSPELRSIDHLMEKERIGIKLAKKNYFPNFSIGLDYVITGEATMPEVMESGKDPVIAMASVQLPLWFKKNRSSVNQAKARYTSALNQKRDMENNLEAHLEMVYYRFKDAKEKMALYRDSLLPKAKQAFNVSRTAYKSGHLDILHLIDSQRTLLNFELSYERALTSFLQRFAELEWLVGKKIY